MKKQISITEKGPAALCKILHGGMNVPLVVTFLLLFSLLWLAQARADDSTPAGRMVVASLQEPATILPNAAAPTSENVNVALTKLSGPAPSRSKSMSGGIIRPDRSVKLLHVGKVVLVGKIGGNVLSATQELYDKTTDSWFADSVYGSRAFVLPRPGKSLVWGALLFPW